MHNPVQVELVPNMVPTSDDVYASRADTAERLGNLGRLVPAEGSVSDVMRDGWLARIAGAEFRVSDFAVQRSEDDEVFLSLVVPVDALKVGDQPVTLPRSEPEPDAAAKVKADRVATLEHLLGRAAERQAEVSGEARAPGAGVPA